MRYSRFFNFFILLFIIPSFVLYPLANIQTQETSIEKEAVQVPALNYPLLSYDQILELIDKVESGELEKNCSVEEGQLITDFLIRLARSGVLPNDTNDELILENDIQELLEGENNPYKNVFFLDQGGSYSIIPAVFYGQNEVVLCGWISKQWKHVKKFVKEHKEEIIIGAIIVVAVAIVVCVIAASSDSSDKGEKNKNEPKSDGATPPSALDDGALTSSVLDKVPIPSSTLFEGPSTSSSFSEAYAATTSVLAAANEAPNFKVVLEDQISSFKELVVEDNLLQSSGDLKDYKDPSFVEVVRYMGSSLAHDTLNGISELASDIPQFVKEAREIAAKILPEKLVPSVEELRIVPAKKNENLVASGHKIIDKIFSTDFADRAKGGGNKFVIGVIPPPSMLVGEVCEALAVTRTAGAVTETVTVEKYYVGRITPTQASNVKGWKVGEDITNLTKDGNVPKWNTVRQRYWKNQEYLHPEEYKTQELERMKQGLAPQRENPTTGKIESKELHHDPAQRDGGLFDVIEVWPDEHAMIDQKRHLGGG